MEKDEEFLHTFFTFISQMYFDKAKEHIEREKDINRTTGQSVPWGLLLTQLQQLLLAEKSYMEIGFLQNKNKGFLRKDNSLRSVYESIKFELKRIEEMSNKQTQQDKRAVAHCNSIAQFVVCRISLIDFYERIYITGASSSTRYQDLLTIIELQISKDTENFVDLSLTPIKAVVTLECSIMEQLFRALTELQRLQFIPALTLLHGASTRLNAWEAKIQNRETWKLGFLKNTQLPALFQWHQRFKGVVLSKFSLYFHDVLATQTTSNDMRQVCSKLLFDFYAKMSSYQKKYDATSVFLATDLPSECVTSIDLYPVIVAHPARKPINIDIAMRMIAETIETNVDKIIYKYGSQERCMLVYVTIEPNIYLAITFDNKKSERDTHIVNFMTEVCTNLRCRKIFEALKTQSK